MRKRERKRETDVHTYRHTDRHRERQTYIHTDIVQTDTVVVAWHQAGWTISRWMAAWATACARQEVPEWLLWKIAFRKLVI